MENVQSILSQLQMRWVKVFIKKGVFPCHQQKRAKLYLVVQCPPLNRITLGHHKSDNNNRMITLTGCFHIVSYSI